MDDKVNAYLFPAITKQCRHHITVRATKDLTFSRQDIKLLQSKLHRHGLRTASQKKRIKKLLLPLLYLRNFNSPSSTSVIGWMMNIIAECLEDSDRLIRAVYKPDRVSRVAYVHVD